MVHEKYLIGIAESIEKFCSSAFCLDTFDIFLPTWKQFPDFSDVANPFFVRNLENVCFGALTVQGTQASVEAKELVGHLSALTVLVLNTTAQEKKD